LFFAGTAAVSGHGQKLHPGQIQVQQHFATGRGDQVKPHLRRGLTGPLTAKILRDILAPICIATERKLEYSYCIPMLRITAPT